MDIEGFIFATSREIMKNETEKKSNEKVILYCLTQTT